MSASDSFVGEGLLPSPYEDQRRLANLAQTKSQFWHGQFLNAQRKLDTTTAELLELQIGLQGVELAPRGAYGERQELAAYRGLRAKCLR